MHRMLIVSVLIVRHCVARCQSQCHHVKPHIHQSACFESTCSTAAHEVVIHSRRGGHVLYHAQKPGVQIPVGRKGYGKQRRAVD